MSVEILAGGPAGSDAGGVVERMQRLTQILEILVEERSGRILVVDGATAVVELPGPVAGLGCALELRRAVIEEAGLRMGVHHGEIRQEGDRLFGSGISVSSRLAAIAGAGEFCLSGAVLDAAPPDLELACDDLGKRRLKGILDPVAVYRVAAAATDSLEAAEAGAAADAARSRESSRDGAIGLGAALAIVAAAALYSGWLAGRPDVGPEWLRVASPPSQDSQQVVITGARAVSERPLVAVLPFAFSGEDVDAFLGAAVADESGRGLAGVAGLEVVEPSTAVRLVGEELGRLRRAAGATLVLSGEVIALGDRVTLASTLREASTTEVLWKSSFEAPREGLVDSIRKTIAGAIAAIPDTPREVVPGTPTAVGRLPASFAAWEAERRAWSPSWFGPVDRPEQARALLAEASALAPEWPRPHAAEAIVWLYLGAFSLHERDEAYELASSALRQGFYLDPDAVDVLLGRVQYLMMAEHAMPQAVALARRAVTLSPGVAATHFWLGSALAAGGEIEAALDALRRARDLGRASPEIYRRLAKCLYFARRYADAEIAARESLRLEPAGLWGRGLLTQILWRAGRHEEAVRVLQEGYSIEGLDEVVASVGALLSSDGSEAVWRAELEKLLADPPDGTFKQGGQLDAGHFARAVRYAELGELESALQALDLALDGLEWQTQWLAVDPTWDVLRDDVRFAALLSRAGL
ncbi:MAG: hypothetical protein VYE73_12470 [Acidobacteriota bacterium]|nr:hypothetical protein [Acidobacteriota bacterium]